MKFLYSIALFAVAGVSAQGVNVGPECDAEYIVDRCLQTENAKVEACNTLDYDCLCAAHQAVATCYNNCPNDSRATDANNLVTIHCQNAELYGTRTTASATASASVSRVTDAAAEVTSGSSETEEEGSASQTTSSEGPEDTGAAGNLARNTGGVLLAVAGAVVALL
ncbi:hypothetical protein B0I35DRAFT_457365 [Stachybotrys elegans]|uniref:Extracellular membrane protein CFEM domain-containing protein n=1 Tax=Stachybotrys elegans TaxID=80388 RepID=A0A8K0T4M6_9HYPO|nr:hypothetical protein B0I35DRAFT_457365 [Stachybotrys elegans]